MNDTDRKIMRSVATAYLCAVTQMETWTPEAIHANAEASHRVIVAVQRSLRSDESWHALVLAFTGFLVALADEPAATGWRGDV